MKTDNEIMELENDIYSNSFVHLNFYMQQIIAILNKKYEKFSKLLLPLFITSLFTANLSIFT